MTTLGSYSLALALLSAAAAALAAIASVRLDRPNLMTTAGRLLWLNAACFTAAAAALLVSLCQSDFSIAYVASYTERALPIGYKMAALWAGQEGSILTWAWLLGACNVAVAFAWRKERGIEAATVIATLALVASFFAALMLFAADPFKLLPTPAADGHGLNPLLQHPSMIAHPPLLFVGYAGFTVPAAMLVGALLAGRRDNKWIARTRGWLIFSWVFLSVGILLGAEWAYVELGWGGYWAWDPGENASLLPWLTGTAALHSVTIQRSRGTFKRWNAWLLTGTFILCIFATYLTRSGVVQSVHAFGQSLVGTFFLIFMLTCIAATILLIVTRRSLLVPDTKVADFRTRMFQYGNITLVAMTAVTALGTMFPTFSEALTNQPVSVGPSFYNTVVNPMALVLIALMAASPLLRGGAGGVDEFMRRAKTPTIIAVVVTIVAVAAGWTGLWSIAAAFITAFAIAATVIDLRQRYLAEQAHATGRSVAAIIFSQRSRYGGQIVHLGVVMMLVGIVGSSLFNTKATLQLKPGEHATVGPYALRYNHLKEHREVNYNAVQAHIEVARGDERFVLHPQLRFYDKSKDAHAEVALKSTLRDDLYITLAGWESGGSVAAFQVIVNPLVNWIWIGGITLTLGALFAWLPMPAFKFAKAKAEAKAKAPVTAPAGRPGVMEVQP